MLYTVSDNSIIGILCSLNLMFAASAINAAGLFPYVSHDCGWWADPACGPILRMPCSERTLLFWKPGRWRPPGGSTRAFLQFLWLHLGLQSFSLGPRLYFLLSCSYNAGNETGSCPSGCLSFPRCMLFSFGFQLSLLFYSPGPLDFLKC